MHDPVVDGDESSPQPLVSTQLLVLSPDSEQELQLEHDQSGLHVSAVPLPPSPPPPVVPEDAADVVKLYVPLTTQFAA